MTGKSNKQTGRGSNQTGRGNNQIGRGNNQAPSAGSSPQSGPPLQEGIPPNTALPQNWPQPAPMNQGAYAPVDPHTGYAAPPLQPGVAPNYPQQQVIAGQSAPGIRVLSSENRAEVSPSAEIPMDPKCKVRIFFRRDVYTEILQQIMQAAPPNKRNTHHVETGGVLAGTFTILPNGEYMVFVEGCVKMDAGTLAEFSISQLQFAHAASEMRKRWPGKIQVGVYHSHPGHSVFHSGPDKIALGKDGGVLVEPYQFSLVIDHISKNRTFRNGHAGIFLDNVQCALFGIDTPFPDLFSSAAATIDNNNGQIDFVEGQHGGYHQKVRMRPSDSGRWRQFTNVLATILCLFVIPFYGFPYVLIGRGMGDAADDRFNACWARFSRKRQSMLKSLCVVLNLGYVALIIVLGCRWEDGYMNPRYLIDLTAAQEIKGSSLAIECTAAGVPPNLPLYLDVSGNDGKTSQRFPLVEAKTLKPAISGPQALHLALDSTLGKSGDYSVKVFTKDPQTSKETFSNAMPVNVFVPLPKPTGFAIKHEFKTARDRTGTIFHLATFHVSWNAPSSEAVSKVIVQLQQVDPNSSSDRSWMNFHEFADSSQHSWVSDPLPVYDSGAAPVYQRFRIEFEDKDRNTSDSDPSTWQRILYAGVKVVHDPDDDSQALDKLARQINDARQAALDQKEQRASNPNPTPKKVVQHRGHGNTKSKGRVKNNRNGLTKPAKKKKNGAKDDM